MSPDCRLPLFGANRLDEQVCASRPREVTEAETPAPVLLTIVKRLWTRFCHRRFTPSLNATKPSEHGISRAAVFPSGAPLARTSKFRLGALWGGAKPPANESTLAQWELELENVRVVRNDLTDADLRIVARTRPAAARSAMKPERTEAQSAPVPESRLVWNRLTARLFVTGRSRLE